MFGIVQLKNKMQARNLYMLFLLLKCNHQRCVELLEMCVSKKKTTTTLFTIMPLHNRWLIWDVWKMIPLLMAPKVNEIHPPVKVITLIHRSPNMQNERRSCWQKSSLGQNCLMAEPSRPLWFIGGKTSITYGVWGLLQHILVVPGLDVDLYSCTP